jgi:hypothetical protein
MSERGAQRAPTAVGAPSPTSPIVAELGAAAVRWLDVVNVILLAPMFGILYMQHHRIHTGWITNYGNDVVGTAWAWWIARRRFDRTLGKLPVFGAPRRAELAVLLVFGAGLAYEVVKRFHLIVGTFDPLNLIPYAATLAFCYVVERVLRRAHR